MEAICGLSAERHSLLWGPLPRSTSDARRGSTSALGTSTSIEVQRLAYRIKIYSDLNEGQPETPRSPFHLRFWVAWYLFNASSLQRSEANYSWPGVRKENFPLAVSGEGFSPRKEATHLPASPKWPQLEQIRGC